jgi:hypothetical protein
MAFYEAYTADQLNRALTASRWMLGGCGVIFVCVAIINQWLTGRITTLERQEKTTAEQRLKGSEVAQQQEKTQTEERLRASEIELARSKLTTTAVTSQLAHFTGPRRLTDEQIALLRKSLPDGPRGKVVMTFLSGESDAQKYAEEIAQLLTETGFDVSISRIRWLKLPVGDIYLCARDVASAPHHAVHIQACFQAAGLRLRGHQDEKMYSDMGVDENAIIFVVSGRERKG